MKNKVVAFLLLLTLALLLNSNTLAQESGEFRQNNETYVYYNLEPVVHVSYTYANNVLFIRSENDYTYEAFYYDQLGLKYEIYHEAQRGCNNERLFISENGEKFIYKGVIYSLVVPNETIKIITLHNISNGDPVEIKRMLFVLYNELSYPLILIKSMYLEDDSLKIAFGHSDLCYVINQRDMR